MLSPQQTYSQRQCKIMINIIMASVATVIKLAKCDILTHDFLDLQVVGLS